MVKCPNCGRNNLTPRKEWYYGPKRDPKRMLVQNYLCSCGASYNAWKRPNSVTVKAIRGRPRKSGKRL